MDIYLFPIKVAVLTFLGVAWLSTIPYMFWQYKKYGSISFYRTLIIFSFVLYILCAYYLIILPLPNPQSLKPVVNIMNHLQLIPFRFIYEIIIHTTLNLTKFSSYLGVFKQREFIQPFFNLMLTVPFGIYLSYYFKNNFKKTVFYTFLLSVFFELTQLTALYGLYPRPYRLFDVDDLMLNTLGGLIGYMIYKHCLFFLPAREKIDYKNLKKSEHVGYIRRLFAFGLDYYLILYISNLFIFFTKINKSNQVYVLLIFTIMLFCYFILSQIIFKQTLGQKLTNLKLQMDSKKQSYILSLIIRYTILIIIIFSYNYLNLMINNTKLNGTYTIELLIIIGLFLIDTLLSLKREKRLLYEKLSKTKNVNTKLIK